MTLKNLFLGILHNKSFPFIGKEPARHFGYFVIQHIRNRNESICFLSIDNDAENSATYYHSGPNKLLVGQNVSKTG